MNRRSFAKRLASSVLLPGCASGLGLYVQPSPGVRFSFMLWALERHATFQRSLEIVAEAGYQGVELTGEFSEWSSTERSDILKFMQAHGMLFDAMSGVKAGFAVPEESDIFFAQFADLLRVAKAIGCPQVILLSGHRVPGMSYEAQRAIAVENLKRAAELAARDSVEIVIEPIDLLEDPTVFLASVSQGFEIATAVGAAHLRVLYDLYHEQRSFGNLLEKLEQHIAQVGLIHVAGVPGRHEPDTGEVNYSDIYRKLAELRYQRWIAMEYYPTGDAVASLRQARLQAVQQMRPL